MATIRINASPRRSAYPVVIRAGLLTSVPGFISQLDYFGKAFVITDHNVAELYGRMCIRDLHNAGFDVSMLDVPPGEGSKRVSMVQGLYNQLFALGLRRSSVIIALGGGVIGDLAGFVAATALRGVRYVQVPTTLLSQVDSSVGGKVGIDHRAGKNLVGVFYPPEAVYIDPVVLKTLPVAEFRAGLAEVVKIAAALDPKFFRQLESKAPSLSRGNESGLSDIIRKSVGLKASVVQNDQFETGLRKVLNVGHTIGHAIEAASRYSVGHGNAVALGLVAEAQIAFEMGFLQAKTVERIRALVRSLKLQTTIPQIQKKKFFAALSADKKRSGSGLEFVLLRDIGESVIGVQVPSHLIEKIVFPGSR